VRHGVFGKELQAFGIDRRITILGSAALRKRGAHIRRVKNGTKSPALPALKRRRCVETSLQCVDRS
jgi:hypothetical protein